MGEQKKRKKGVFLQRPTVFSVQFLPQFLGRHADIVAFGKQTVDELFVARP